MREMVEAPHPLKYIRRFIVLQEDILAAQQARLILTAADPPIPGAAPVVSPAPHTIARFN
jgi:hypothetical protein